MSKTWTPTGTSESPWPDEEPQAQVGSAGLTADETIWQNATPEELLQYLRVAHQIALEEHQQHLQTLEENQQFRQTLASIEEAFHLDIETLLSTSAEDLRAGLEERAKRLQAERERDQARENEQRETERRRRAEQHITEQRKLWKTKFKPAEKAFLSELQRQIDYPTERDAQGYSKICWKTAAVNMGMGEKAPQQKFAAVMEQCPAIADAIETKETKEARPDGDGTFPRTWVRSSENLVQLAIRAGIPQELKREQGGNQYECQKCHSKRVVILRRLHCLDCHHEIDLEPTYPNGQLKSKSGTEGKTNLVSDQEDPSLSEKNLSEADQSVGVVIKPLTPQTDKLAESESNEGNEIVEAARLLLEVAGPDADPIEMSRSGRKKYYPVEPRRALKLADLVDHLRGGRAKGALCSHGEQTRASIFDADDDADWQRLSDGAFQLVEAGYAPLLEQSPAGGHKPGEAGGHLWVIFDALVNAAAARAAILQVAPALQEIKEYWPKPEGGRVRLPGGKYARTGPYAPRAVVGWCPLVNVATGESSRDGLSSARLLLGGLTPATIVPVAAPVEDDQARVSEPVRERRPAPAPIVPGSRPLPVVDDAWMKKHGSVEKTTLWFAITEDRAAAWFNESHSLESIRPRERNGLALSPNGSERTASTSYHQTAQGERFTDHSAHGQRSDGTKDSGDALELASKVWNESKASLLKETVQEMIAQACAGMESAAKTGQYPLTWIVELMTPAGWRKYDQLAPITQASQSEACQEESENAAAGYTVDDSGDYVF
jgi:hypothetical protein